MICTKIKGEYLYEAVKPISAHQELIVYYLLEQHERPEDFLFVHMRSSIYRKTLNSILEGESSPVTLKKPMKIYNEKLIHLVCHKRTANMTVNVK